jgi:hypothetical protein
LLLRQGHPKEAEELYQRALGIAAEQEARLWALRAATNLARLWDEQGRRLAHDLLKPVFSWFTEGLDTADLKEAATLLAEVGVALGSATSVVFQTAENGLTRQAANQDDRRPLATETRSSSGAAKYSIGAKAQ